MEEDLIRKQQKKVCSIEYLRNESPREEMLLSSENRNNTIEEEDQLFDLYITPLNKRSSPHDLNLLYDEDQSIFHSRKQDEPSTQLYRQHYQGQDTIKLKAIIDKKNKTIDQVTEELKILSLQVKQLKKIAKKQGLKNSKAQRGKNLNDQIQFLQKNNLELFQELNKCRKQKESLQKALQASKDKITQLEQSVKDFEKKNKELMKQNSSLLIRTKQFLTESQKEIKYFNKIREIFYQKTGIQDYNILQNVTQRNNQTYSKQNHRVLRDQYKNSSLKSPKTLLFDKSNTTHRKNNSPQKYSQLEANFSHIKLKERDLISGSLDVERFSKSQRCSYKTNKAVEVATKGIKFDNLL